MISNSNKNDGSYKHYYRTPDTYKRPNSFKDFAAKTLDNYVDYRKLSRSKIANDDGGGINDCNRISASAIPRFIATAVNVMTSEPIIFV